MIARTGMSREKFPRGMSQPEKGYRFSVDSLLLSCFISPGQESRVVDIGCGCGVVGLGLILANPQKNIRVTGLDKCPDMISHSRLNSELLNLSPRFIAKEHDLSRVNSRHFKAESFDLALTNPPYRKPGAGRFPQDKSRLQAIFCEDDELGYFFNSASFLLKNKGKIGIVFGADRMSEIIDKMMSSSLIPKKILPVYGSLTKPARLVLVEGIKNAGPGLMLLPPLILYNQSKRLTTEALEFCPFLGCNPGR